MFTLLLCSLLFPSHAPCSPPLLLFLLLSCYSYSPSMLPYFPTMLPFFLHMLPLAQPSASPLFLLIFSLSPILHSAPLSYHTHSHSQLFPSWRRFLLPFKTPNSPCIELGYLAIVSNTLTKFIALRALEGVKLFALILRR